MTLVRVSTAAICQQAAPEVITRKLDGLIIHREKLTDDHYARLRECCRPPHSPSAAKRSLWRRLWPRYCGINHSTIAAAAELPSGGEPFMNPELAQQLFQASHEAGIHTAVETCLHVPWKYVAPSLPWVNLFSPTLST